MSWPFSVATSPSHWSETRLRSVLARRKQLGRPDLPLLSVNLPVGVVRRLDGDGRPAPSLDLSGYQEVRPGDVVMNQLGKPHGAIGVSKYHGITSPAYFVSEVLPAAEPRYVHHLLRTDLFISEYQRRGKNLPPNQFDISWDQFREIEISLPPLEEQRAIADYLDAETARIDALIAKKQKLIHLLEERRPLLLQGAFERAGCVLPRLPGIEHRPSAELPNNWSMPKLSNVLRQLTNGFVGPTRDILVEEGIPYIQGTHIKGGRINFGRRPFYVRPDWHTARPRTTLRPGDVLIVQTGDIGRCAVVPDDFGQANCHALLVARAEPSVISGEYLAIYMPLKK